MCEIMLINSPDLILVCVASTLLVIFISDTATAGILFQSTLFLEILKDAVLSLGKRRNQKISQACLSFIIYIYNR